MMVTANPPCRSTNYKCNTITHMQTIYMQTLTLPLPFQVEWISRRVQKGFWTEELGPSSFRLPPPHIVCYSATSFWQQVMLTIVGTATEILIFKTENWLCLKGGVITHNAVFPYLSCTVANWGGSAGLLTLSSFPGQHGGIMVSSRISWGYLK